MPDAELSSNIRRQRYLALARNLASIVGTDIEAEYAGMIARGLLAENPDAKSLRLACVQHFTPSTSDEPPDNPNAVFHEDGSYTATGYRCHAWQDPETGAVEIRKEEEARRLSPVTRNDEPN